jgi:Polyketide cyclase / dehydrase and lipid transport
MASIIKEISIDAEPADAWVALRDFAAVHERLVPGFVVACELEGPDTRVVTFFNGAVAREVLVGIDDDARRLAYTVVEGPLDSTHHNASAQVVPEVGGGCRFVWITDVLPHDVAGMVSEIMDRGIAVIKHTLESQTSQNRL